MIMSLLLRDADCIQLRTRGNAQSGQSDYRCESSNYSDCLAVCSEPTLPIRRQNNGALVICRVSPIADASLEIGDIEHWELLRPVTRCDHDVILSSGFV